MSQFTHVRSERSSKNHSKTLMNMKILTYRTDHRSNNFQMKFNKIPVRKRASTQRSMLSRFATFLGFLLVDFGVAFQLAVVSCRYPWKLAGFAWSGGGVQPPPAALPPKFEAGVDLNSINLLLAGWLAGWTATAVQLFS